VPKSASLGGRLISPSGAQARRQALPVSTEDADPRKQHLQRAYAGRKRPRLQRLYLLASAQAHARQAVAQLLGVPRHTIGHGLTISEAEGLDVLLALYVPAGKPLALPPDVLAAIGQALQQPRGLASELDFCPSVGRGS
jgi:hypothetical protein